MDCETIRRLGLADEYRAGRLAPDETDAYEQHYYACPRCFDDLQFRDRVAGYLKEDGERLFAEDRLGWEPAAAERPEVIVWPESPPAPSRRGRPARRLQTDGAPWWNRLLPGPAWSWGVALVAASVFVAVLAGTYADRKEHLFRLARPAPYPYVASELRGDEPLADFDRAMELYKAGQYRDAAVLLDSCAREEPGDPDVHFYLGVARLLENRPRDAVLSLQTAVRLAPASSVYRWHLVQALLCTGDRRTVLRELNILAAGIDEYAAQARQLRARIYAGG